MNKKIILFFLLIAFLFSGTFSLAFATEVDLPGWDPEAVERKGLLPKYIRWLFNFSIVIVGLVAFGALVYAGFSYLTSAGNPTKISDAKDRIFAAFLGLVILLSSYLILTTIDPHLVILKAPEIEPTPEVEPYVPPTFDFDFSIDPTEDTISSKARGLFGLLRGNSIAIRLEAELVFGEPEKVVFSVLSGVPNNVGYSFPSFPWPNNCSPTCNKTLQFVSDGAAPGPYNIKIEARSGDIVIERTFKLTIVE